MGMRWWLRRGDRALPAALVAAALLWLYSLLAGTPYQEAKALVLIAPLVMAISVRALLASELPAIVAIAFLGAAGGSAVLALANGPVGPSGYSPQLLQLSKGKGGGSVQVEVPDELLDDQHGLDWVAWEMRGRHVCIVRESAPGPRLPAGLVGTVTLAIDEDGAVLPAGIVTREGVPDGPGPCPLIPDAARADPSAGG